MEGGQNQIQFSWLLKDMNEIHLLCSVECLERDLVQYCAYEVLHKKCLIGVVMMVHLNYVQEFFVLFFFPLL